MNSLERLLALAFVAASLGSLSAAQSDSPPPSSIVECEAGGCGVWSFTGKNGVAQWKEAGVSANLRIRRFDSSGVQIERTDYGKTAGLKASYIGTRNGDLIQGNVSWTWPGHDQLSTGTAAWYALIERGDPGKTLIPTSILECEDATKACTTWSFHGKDGQGEWPGGVFAELSVQRFDDSIVSIRRTDRKGLVQGWDGFYVGTRVDTHVEGTLIWSWPNHGQYSLGSSTWRAEIPESALPRTEVANTETRSRKQNPAPTTRNDDSASTLAASSSIQNGSYYALVIGINQYRKPLPALQTAVHDADGVAQILRERYGFQVKMLLNGDATRTEILNALARYRRSLQENDNLLIYYAGHGVSDSDADKAYWLPVDADRDVNSNWISADDLTTAIKVLPARHVLIISDSCYSGGLTRDVRLDARPDDQKVFVRKMLASKSRTLMSSGGNEPVADGGPDDHSIFASIVLRALEQTREPSFTAGDLFHNFVEQQVTGRSDQVPRYSFIRNSAHDSGDFVFMRSDVSRRKSK